MHRQKTETFKNLFNAFLKANNLEKKYLESQVIEKWPEVVGRAVTNRTKNIYIREGVLFVQLNSSVARNELEMIRIPLIQALNKAVEAEVVKDIVFRG